MCPDFRFSLIMCALASYKPPPSTYHTFENLALNSFGEHQLGDKTAGGLIRFNLNSTNRPLGAKTYELSNHLGNVLATVSDRKLWSGSTRIADVKSASDYYPFGMNIGDRTMSLAGYRYGFNGKEKDPSGEWGSQAIYDYGFRIYNPGLGKFLSVDPLAPKYPMLTCYQFASNSPIANIDLDGLERVYYTWNRNIFGIKTKLEILHIEDIVTYTKHNSGGLSNAPIIDVPVYNAHAEFIDVEIMIQEKEKQQEIDRQRQEFQKGIASVKARNSNIYATMYDLSPAPDILQISRHIEQGETALAAVGVIFVFTPGEFDDVAGKIITRKLNPHHIRFSQSSVNGADEIISSMRKDGWNGDPIDVVHMKDGGLTSIDNTRVLAASEAGIDVQAIVHKYDDPLPKEFVERFTTKKGTPTTWGEAIDLRIGKQKKSYRDNNPNGSYNIQGNISN